MTSSQKKKRSKGSFSSFWYGYLETWFAGEEDSMATFLLEMSRKQINIPKVFQILLGERAKAR